MVRGGNKNYNDYFWDEIGLCVTSTPERYAMRISLHWEFVPDSTGRDDEVDEIPKSFFKGKVLLNGFPIDNTTDIKSYCENQAVRDHLKRLARKKGIDNYEECFYYYSDYSGFYRYNQVFHKLYLFDYERFRKLSDDDELPFFSYLLKIYAETSKLHAIEVVYDVYTNPDFKPWHLH